MSNYQTFTVIRLTEPDLPSLLTQLRALDNTAGIQHESGTQQYIIKKSSIWTIPQITAVQNILNNAINTSPQLTAQAIIDSMSISEKAIILTILDQFNLVRSKLSPPLVAITVDQMIASIRAKAGTL